MVIGKYCRINCAVIFAFRKQFDRCICYENIIRRQYIKFAKAKHTFQVKSVVYNQLQLQNLYLIVSKLTDYFSKIILKNHEKHIYAYITTIFIFNK